MAKIGIFGGSFDPIHIGHTAIAKTAREKLSLSKVIFIPSGTPPHKMNKTLADNNDRFNMTCLATEGCDKFFVSDIEINKETPCYSYETLKELKKMYPDDELYFIIGSDSLLSLSSWKRPDRLGELCVFVAVNREDEGNEDKLADEQERLLKEFNIKSVIINMKKVPVSSTDIRNRIKNGEDITGLVDKRVGDYIETNKLYR